MTAAPALPDDPHAGDVGHLLVVDQLARVWWRVHRDGTRTRIGSEQDAADLVRTWLAYRTPLPITAGGITYQPPSEYVGDRYTVRFVRDPADLDRWPDVTPERTFP